MTDTTTNTTTDTSAGRGAGDEPGEEIECGWFIRQDAIEVGDWLDGAFLSDAHGAVTAIEPYACSSLCQGCHGAGCAERAGWRYLVLRDGTEITITPGGLFPASCGPNGEAPPAPARRSR